MRAYVYWSFYVRTSNKRKLIESHLPAIDKALEASEFDWQIIVEPESPGEFRIVNYQNLEGRSVGELVTTVLRRAYRLANGWKIFGLEGLGDTTLRHVFADCNPAKTSHPPALTSAMFEISPGCVMGKGDEGGFLVERASAA